MFRRVAVCFALLFAGTVAAAPAPIQDHTAKVGDVELHYVEAGSGNATPVILLHGFAQTSHMWLPLIPKVDGDRKVVAVDLRGAGDSSKPPAGYDKKTMAEDIHALAKSLGFKKVILVGHDIGLMVAYAYAAQHPDEVERIVLMDAFLPGVGDTSGIFLLRDKWHFNFYGETPLKLVNGRERIYLEHFWNDFAADRNHSVSEADRVVYASKYAQPDGMRATMDYFRAFDQDSTDFAAMAKTKLTMPMLVLSGEKSGGDFLINQGKMVDTNVKGVIIKGSGHWIIDEAPEQTMAELVAFIQQPAAG